MQNQFPSNEDFSRVARLNNFYNVFKGLHNKVFKLKSYFEEDQKKRTLLYLAYNVGQIVSLTSADFLFGEQLKIQTNKDNEKKPLEEKINKIMQKNYLLILILTLLFSVDKRSFNQSLFIDQIT